MWLIVPPRRNDFCDSGENHVGAYRIWYGHIYDTTKIFMVQLWYHHKCVCRVGIAGGQICLLGQCTRPNKHICIGADPGGLWTPSGLIAPLYSCGNVHRTFPCCLWLISSSSVHATQRLVPIRHQSLCCILSSPTDRPKASKSAWDDRQASHCGKPQCTGREMPGAFSS